MNTGTNDLRDEVEKLLKKDSRSLKWLSEKSGIKYSYIYSCFRQRLFMVNKKNLKKINNLLGTSFERPIKNRAKKNKVRIY